MGWAVLSGRLMRRPCNTKVQPAQGPRAPPQSSMSACDCCSEGHSTARSPGRLSNRAMERCYMGLGLPLRAVRKEARLRSGSPAVVLMGRGNRQLSSNHHPTSWGVCGDTVTVWAAGLL